MAGAVCFPMVGLGLPRRCLYQQWLIAGATGRPVSRLPNNHHVGMTVFIGLFADHLAGPG